MTRLLLYNTVKSVCPAYWIGQHQGECKFAYAVIKYNSQSSSISNSKAGWQYVEILIYVPKSSVSGLDETLDMINTKLIELGLESTGRITPDYLDVEKSAFMRSAEYRIPKQV